MAAVPLEPSERALRCSLVASWDGIYRAQTNHRLGSRRCGLTARLIDTKLRPPPIDDSRVYRPQLYERFADRSGRVGLVTAPPGFGKASFVVTTEWEPNRVFGYRMTEGDFFKGHDERWVIEPTEDGSRFTFNDQLEFPCGPIGKIIGWFAARGAEKTGHEMLGNLKQGVVSEAKAARHAQCCRM